MTMPSPSRSSPPWKPNSSTAEHLEPAPDISPIMSPGRISHDPIYQALYVQGRGALKRELMACLRTGRALRVPRARALQTGGAVKFDQPRDHDLANVRPRPTFSGQCRPLGRRPDPRKMHSSENDRDPVLSARRG